ncbi:hypothetical protein EMPS_03996 [Entomortierella parvispora]|uniref:Uncharacterized protein n=1 Tax=Entomortierella parvispora TaxID=205924 RepID=A0A9P3H7P1_9FUNG|nr:hypothetical protein EMPS_03996 [Entomortierella parvispora]
MAGYNMVNAVQGCLLHQQRPLYLQPVNEHGRYPWMASDDIKHNMGEQIEDAGASCSNGGKGHNRLNDEEGLSTEPDVIWRANDVLMDQAPGPGDSSISFNAVSNTYTLEDDQDGSHCTTSTSPFNHCLHKAPPSS